MNAEQSLKLQKPTKSYRGFLGVDGWFPHYCLICATMHSQDAKRDLSLQVCLESPQYTDIFKEIIQDMGAFKSMTQDKHLALSLHSMR